MRKNVFILCALTIAGMLFTYVGCKFGAAENAADDLIVSVAANRGSPPAQARLGKVLLCHNTGNGGRVIEVPENGAARHLEHGDCLAPAGAVRGEACTCLFNPDPECAGITCENVSSCNPSSLCESPVCVTTAEGGGVCVEGAAACPDLVCPGGAADCPPGWICAVQTCCLEPICIPPELFCPEDGALGGTARARRLLPPEDYAGPRIGGAR